MLNQITALFELLIEVFDHEAYQSYGLYQTQDLAEAARDTLLAAWPDGGYGKPDELRTVIKEHVLLNEVPRFHYYAASAQLNSEDVEVFKLDIPEIRPYTASPQHWLDDKVRFVAVAPDFVRGTGHTGEEARSNAIALRDSPDGQALAAYRRQCHAIQAQFKAELPRRLKAAGIAETDWARSWDFEFQLREELAIAVFGITASPD